MILEELTLVNFCLYRGRQVFELTPGGKGPKARPIVLFGGINGGGKTTVLDAIQLALYGPRARTSKRLNGAYDDYLRACIHRGVQPGEGAAVSLSFRYASDGEEHLYEVHRAWRDAEGKIRETLSVARDGAPDKWLSDNWAQLVEDLVPLGISQLFFFDAEKIRFLAEDETGNEALGAAIKSLLGLDLAERLIADASVLEARLAKKLVASDEQQRLEELERQIAADTEALLVLKQERAALENDWQRAENEKEQAKRRFESVGGSHWDERQAQERRKADLEAQQDAAKAQLVALAAGELPLALVGELRQRVVEQGQREYRATESLVVERMLEERDRRVLDVLREGRVPAKTLKLLADVLDGDRRARHVAAQEPGRLGLSEHARSMLTHLDHGGLDERLGEARRLLDGLRQLEHDHEAIVRSLAATPAEERIKDVTVALQEATSKSAVLTDTAKRLDARISTAVNLLEALKTKQQKLVRKEIDRDLREEEHARMARTAARTRTTMQEFLRRATAAKIDRLSSRVTESFRFLLRKQTLVEQIMIDPATFAITLFGADGQAISKQRLSEGEKQIFAISVLWGLARASARSLPAIIDTPMARLDAKHREHLVERYFPNASHQVIVLSTDTEVDRRYYEVLGPSVARAYHLNYNDEEKATVAEEGYFWTERHGEPAAEGRRPRVKAGIKA